jgi:hypothetical protein
MPADWMAIAETWRALLRATEDLERAGARPGMSREFGRESVHRVPVAGAAKPFATRSFQT